MSPVRRRGERTETELLRDALAGRRDAYGEIFKLHRERAYGLAYQYTHNKEDALDVVQDASNQPKADRQVLKGEVWDALAKLADAHREIVFLKDYQGHSYAEIAEILGIPIGTVMSRLHHARKKLAEAVREGREPHAV